MSNSLAVNQRFQGGSKSRILRAGDSITNGKVFEFQALEDSALSILTAEDGEACLEGHLAGDVYATGIHVPLPRPAKSITVASGRIQTFER